MPYWMTNPSHGVMPCYDLGEVERNKVHGWTLLNEGPAPVYPKAEPTGMEITHKWVTSNEAARKKPGPKPKAKP